MKAISLKQPWAWLITNGYKDVENRTWKPRNCTEFYIHASKQFDQQGYEFVKKNMSYIKMPGPKEFEQGGIIGKAKIKEITKERKSKWHNEGDVGIYLEEVEQLPFMPCKGKLGMFEVDYE